MPAEQSNKGTKRWTIPICTGCGGIVGGPGEPACTCDRTHAKTGKHVEVVPAPRYSPPIEEKSEFRVTGACELSSTRFWLRNDYKHEGDALYGAMHARMGGASNVQVQSRTITAFVDGSSLTSPWTDLPGEEGER